MACMQSAVVIPEMLEDGIRVMVYVGEMDLKWNWVGVRRWVDALPWSGAADWAAAEDCEWQVGGKRAGRIRQSGLLSFVRVYDAGHLVRLLRMSWPVAGSCAQSRRGTRAGSIRSSRQYGVHAYEAAATISHGSRDAGCRRRILCTQLTTSLLFVSHCAAAAVTTGVASNEGITREGCRVAGMNCGVYSGQQNSARVRGQGDKRAADTRPAVCTHAVETRRLRERE